mgnify:FL=1
MRIARVIGNVTMSRKMPEILPGSYLVVRTVNRRALAGTGADNEETLVLYDNLGAREGDLVGLVEGAEACAPFRPQKVPYDCYNACILEQIDFRPILDAGGVAKTTETTKTTKKK